MPNSTLKGERTLKFWIRLLDYQVNEPKRDKVCNCFLVFHCYLLYLKNQQYLYTTDSRVVLWSLLKDSIALSVHYQRTRCTQYFFLTVKLKLLVKVCHKWGDSNEYSWRNSKIIPKLSLICSTDDRPYYQEPCWRIVELDTTFRKHT